MTYTREDIYSLLSLISLKACVHSEGRGLPEHGMEEYADIVISNLGLTIMEDERILTIQKYTGRTRAQAQSLIDSGDI